MPVLSNAEGNTTRPACPSGSASKKSRRGGRRPGAGAPRGNLNALKHGRNSAQGVYPERSRRAQLGVLLATSPTVREALLALARRHRLKQRRAEEVATLLLQRLIDRAHQIGQARLPDRTD